MYTVSITSQGQITIPAKVRMELGLEKRKKATLRVHDGVMEIKPAKTITDFYGIFKTNKKISSKIAREKFEDYLVQEAAK